MRDCTSLCGKEPNKLQSYARMLVTQVLHRSSDGFFFAAGYPKVNVEEEGRRGQCW